MSPELLALLALGERVGSPSESAHLATCATCQAQLRSLEETVVVGRASLDTGALQRPAPAVWDRVAAELGFASGSGEPSSAGAGASEVSGPDHARRRRWRRIIAIGAATVLIVAGALVIVRLATPSPDATLASASLDAFPLWQGSDGTAVIERRADGSVVLSIRVHVDRSTPDSREVWLMTKNLGALVSVGDLRGDTGVFSIPADVDLSHYDVVDVSDEPNDGNPAHSGNSIVRGVLRQS